jgi:hypothetical protein
MSHVYHTRAVDRHLALAHACHAHHFARFGGCRAVRRIQERHGERSSRPGGDLRESQEPAPEGAGYSDGTHLRRSGRGRRRLRFQSPKFIRSPEGAASPRTPIEP